MSQEPSAVECREHVTASLLLLLPPPSPSIPHRAMTLVVLVPIARKYPSSFSPINSAGFISIIIIQSALVRRVKMWVWRGRGGMGGGRRVRE